MVRAKEIALLVVLAGFGSLAFTCVGKQHTSPEEETRLPITIEASGISEAEEVLSNSDTLPNFSEVSEGTRVALVNTCGRCHQSTLPTHKPGAIAIFDLDQGENWHDRLTAQTLQGMAKRTQNNTTLTEEEHATIKKFVDLKQEKLQ